MFLFNDKANYMLYVCLLFFAFGVLFCFDCYMYICCRHFLGLIVSMCLPCTSNSDFIGVVCTDIKLSDLVEDTTYLQQGQNTYSFIIDGTGRTLIHPLLPDPRESNANEYDVDNIDNFETGGNVKEVIESMKLCVKRAPLSNRFVLEISSIIIG